MRVVIRRAVPAMPPEAKFVQSFLFTWVSPVPGSSQPLAADQLPQRCRRSTGRVQWDADLPAKEDQHTVAVLQDLVQVGGDEHDRGAFLAAFLEPGPDVDGGFDIQPAGGMLQQQQR